MTEDVTVANAAWLEGKAKRVLSGAVQVTTALTIPTPAGPAVVSLTTTRTTPTSTTSSCVITANDELLRTLRSMEQQNARLPREMFPMAIKPLLDVPRTTARKALGPSFGPAKASPLPLAAEPSPIVTDSSRATYATANECLRRRGTC